MPDNQLYQPISDLIRIGDLPPFLSLLQNGVESLFDKIYYKDFRFSKSKSGDAAFFNLKIVTKDKLALQLPGTEIFLVLNPDADDAEISSFPISAGYVWPVLDYFGSFNIQGFSFAPLEYFNTGISVLRISENDIISHAVNTFTDDDSIDPITDFVALLNARLVSNVPLPQSADPITELTESIPQYSGKSVPQAIFEGFIQETDIETTRSGLASYMRGFYRRILKIILND